MKADEVGASRLERRGRELRVTCAAIDHGYSGEGVQLTLSVPVVHLNNQWQGSEEIREVTPEAHSWLRMIREI
jgi:hypothetical protein